jgi:hypothetical protein
MNFGDIPLEDIKYLLFDQPLSDNIYLQAWNYLLTHPNIKVPKSISDWIIAYNIKDINIPKITAFDIITSKNGVLGLSNEEAINVIKYLHKLDETNPFENLPPEVIIKILSEYDFDCEQIFLLCKLSKQFHNICNLNYKTIFNNIFSGQGYNLNEFDPKIMCKALKLGTNRDIFVALNKNKYIINTKGNIYKLHYYDDKYNITLMETINNIISFTPVRGGFILLDSLGNVYKTDGEEIIKLKIKNIVQLSRIRGNVFYLDIDGNVFMNKKSIPIIRNIAKIYNKFNIILLLDKNNNIYELEDNKPNKLLLPTNIKDIFINLTSTFIITTDGELFYFERRGGYNLKQLQIHIDKLVGAVKIDTIHHKILILDTSNVLHAIDINNPHEINAVHNVKDFCAGELPAKILILHNDGNLGLYNYQLQMITEEIKTSGKNIRFISSECLIMDNKIYSIDYNKDKFILNEISI